MEFAREDFFKNLLMVHQLICSPSLRFPAEEEDAEDSQSSSSSAQREAGQRNS